jgi:FkbM family methyltransferase
VTIPVRGVGGRLLLEWTPTWKTVLLDRLLRERAGWAVDVGANVGQTLLDIRWSDAGSDHNYLAVEPNPTCAAYLHDVLDANHWPNCAVVSLALSDTPRLLPLYRSHGAREDTLATLEPSVHVLPDSEAQVVPCFAFDALVEPLGINALSVVKIDVEGHEADVLAGMLGSLTRWRPPILCEVLDASPGTDLSAHATRVAATQERMRAVDYRIAHLHTGNGARAWTWEETAFLPVRSWSARSMDDCDYLFVPQEAWTRTTRLLDDATNQER